MDMLPMYRQKGWTIMSKSNYPYYSELRKEHLAEWRIWYKMIYSCREDQKYYVETQVCDDWQGEEGFIQWLDDLGPRPSDDHVLNRINKLGNYEKGNVEWALKPKCYETLRLDHTAYGAGLKTAKQNGIPGEMYRRRVKEFGWSIKDASTIPTSPGRKYYLDRTI